MKKIFPILICLLSWSIGSYGQTIDKSDSLKVMEAVSKVFMNFRSPTFSEFKEISTNEITCTICEGALDLKLGQYVIKRKDFFNIYLKEVLNDGHWERASNSKEIMLGKGYKPKDDIIVYFTTWKMNEYAPGHEGAQLGIHFKKVDGQFKFAGISSIP